MPLTDKQIKALKPEKTRKKYFDGGGLYLEVSPNGGKWWRLKYYFQGKDRRISIGVYPAVSLKEARVIAAEMREGLRYGIDPALRKKDDKHNKTFEEVAREWLEKQKGLWTDAHSEKIKTFLESKVYSSLGGMTLTIIQPPDALALCKLIEQNTLSYMAHIILSLISRVMRYGVACGYIQSDPCRDLKGALAPYKENHMPAVTDPAKVGELVLRIDGYKGNALTRNAMKLMLLCMCRTIEARGARWEEIDFDNDLWRIPAERMKMRREHLVPLSRQAKDLLLETRALTGRYELVFPSFRSKSRRMSENTINAALRALGYEKGEVVGHGFRSTASTLLNELGWVPDVIEAQLAHASQGSVRAAYNRAAWLDDRRRMLQAWANHLDILKGKAALRR